jgi:hypothetical protein
MESHSHREVQQKLINKLILSFAIIAVPISSISFYRIVDIGFQALFIIHFIATIIMILLAIFRESLPYVTKVVSLIILFFIIGIASFINLGIASFYTELMMLAILIGIVFWGKIQALFIFITSSVVILIMAVSTTEGIVSPTINIDTYALHLSSWISMLAGFVLISALTILLVGEIGYSLSDKINELQKKQKELQIAYDEIRKLEGIIPICTKCKKIRDSDGYWNQVESYIEQHSEAQFSHGICEQCAKELYGDDKWYQKK